MGGGGVERNRGRLSQLCGDVGEGCLEKTDRLSCPLSSLPTQSPPFLKSGGLSSSNTKVNLRALRSPSPPHTTSDVIYTTA